MSKMPTIKVFYGVLLSGLVAYFLLYSFLLRKIPVVKIYFEDETRLNQPAILQQDYGRHTSLQSELEDGVSSLEHESNLNPANDYSKRETKAQENNRAIDSIMSFLEAFGLPVNKKQMDHIEITTTPPPKVNPHGASLPELLKKLERSLNWSASSQKPCPTKHLTKVGLLEVDNNTVDLEQVEHQLHFVSKGGRWKPGCKPRRKVAIVVPFRDRQSHLNIFLRHMHQFLQWQLLDYRIFITEQVDDKPFNRGMLMNVGFQEAMKKDNFSCVIFHDVDLMPEDARNDYGCPSSPRHMSTAVNSMDYKLKYKTLFGGVEGFWSEHYIIVNGFPNRFWGWGGEDDDLYVRITEKGLGLTRPAQMIGRYTMLGHMHTESDANPGRFDELRRSEVSIETDGLHSLAYSVLNYQELRLYTFISVQLG